MSTTFRRFFSLSIFSALLTVCRMVASFLIMKLVAVLYGPTGVALAGQVQTFVNVIQGIVSAPISPGVVHYTAQNHANGVSASAPWWKAALWCVGLLILTFNIVGYLFYNPISELVFADTQYSWVVLISLVLLPISSLGSFVASILIGQQKILQHTLFNFMGLLLSSVSMVIAIIWYPHQGVLIAMAIQNTIIGACMLFAVIGKPWAKLSFFIGKVQWKYLKDILKYTLIAITTATAMPIALLLIRQAMLTTLGSHETGVWQSVWKISEAYIGIITTALSIFFLPALSKCTNTEEEKNVIQQTLLMTITVTILMSILIYMSRHLIISLLYTPDFYAASSLFLLQLTGDFAKAITWVFIYILIAKGQTIILLTLEIGFAILFVTLCNILLPLYQMNSITIAYNITYFLYVFFAIIVYSINWRSNIKSRKMR